MIPTFLLTKLPRIVKLALSKQSKKSLRKFLENYLYKQTEGIADQILRAKKNTEKLKNNQALAKDIFLNYLHKSFLGNLPTISVSSRENLILNILSSLQLKVDTNKSKIGDYEDSLIYKIAQGNIFKTNFNLGEITDKINTEFAKNVTGKYGKTIQVLKKAKDEEGKTFEYYQTEYINTLVFIYLAEGENSLIEYLKKQGYNSLYERNRIIKYVKKASTIDKSKYQPVLRKLKKLKGEIEEIYDVFGVERNF